MRHKSAFRNFLHHLLLMEFFFLLLASEVKGKVIQRSVLCKGFGDFVDLGLESVLGVDFLLDHFLDHFLLLLILLIETMDFVLISLMPSLRVRLTNDIRSDIDLWLERALSFL